LSWEELGKTQVKIDPSQNAVQLTGSKVLLATNQGNPVSIAIGTSVKVLSNVDLSKYSKFFIEVAHSASGHVVGYKVKIVKKSRLAGETAPIEVATMPKTGDASTSEYTVVFSDYINANVHKIDVYVESLATSSVVMPATAYVYGIL
jgi:hypothetical protein